jgi:hypothetical protein
MPNERNHAEELKTALLDAERYAWSHVATWVIHFVRESRLEPFRSGDSPLVDAAEKLLTHKTVLSHSKEIWEQVLERIEPAERYRYTPVLRNAGWSIPNLTVPSASAAEIALILEARKNSRR